MTDAPNVIITRQGASSRMREYSQRRPGTVIVCANTGKIARDGAVVKLTSRTVLYGVLALISRPGTIISSEFLVDALYGEDEDGGPISAMSTIVIPDMKVAAAALAFRIETHGKRGWSAKDMRGPE